MPEKTKETCRSARLTLYHFDDLIPEEREQMEEHLAGCPGCRAELREIRRTLGAIPDRSLKLTDGETWEFAAGVMRRVRGRRAAGAWPSAIGGGIAVTAVLLLTLLRAPDPQTLPRASETPGLKGLTAAEEVELLQNMEILENLDLLQSLVVEQG